MKEAGSRWLKAKEHLLCKPKDLNSNPLYPCRNPGMVRHVPVTPLLWGAETGGLLRLSGYYSSFSFSERQSQGDMAENEEQDSRCPLSAHMFILYTYTHAIKHVTSQQFERLRWQEGH